MNEYISNVALNAYEWKYTFTNECERKHTRLAISMYEWKYKQCDNKCIWMKLYCLSNKCVWIDISNVKINAYELKYTALSVHQRINKQYNEMHMNRNILQ